MEWFYENIQQETLTQYQKVSNSVPKGIMTEIKCKGLEKGLTYLKGESEESYRKERVLRKKNIGTNRNFKRNKLAR